MNKVILTRRLVADPEVSFSQKNRSKIARYRLAVERAYKQDGQPEADFLNCVTFQKNADFAEAYLRKGAKILIEGKLLTGSYEKDGVKHYTLDVIVDRHEFCESKKTEAKQEQSSGAQTAFNASAADVCPTLPETADFTEIDDEDLPF